jgi:hypothetical protein
MRFMGVEHPISHGPAGFHVKYFGKFPRFVAGYHDVGSLHFVEYLFTLQEAFRQFGVRYGQERVELGVVLTLLLPVAGHDDAAGADIQAQRLCIFLFGVVHQ